MSECTNCPHAEKIAYLEKTLEKSDNKNSEQHKEFYESITSIKLSAMETQSEIKVMNGNIDRIFEIMKTIQDDTRSLKEKPSKRLDAVAMSVTSSTIALIVSLIVNQIIK